MAICQKLAGTRNRLEGGNFRRLQYPCRPRGADARLRNLSEAWDGAMPVTESIYAEALLESFFLMKDDFCNPRASAESRVSVMFSGIMIMGCEGWE